MNQNPRSISKTRLLLFFAALLSVSIVLSQEYSNLNANSKIGTETKDFNGLVTNEDNENLSDQNNHIALNNSFFYEFLKPIETSESSKNKAPKWKKFKSELGAFSVNLPGDPKDMSRDTPNPLNEDGDPYHINMYSASDEKNDVFYLVRYNDMPNGYYLSDRQAGFASIQEGLTGKAVLLSDPKEITLSGTEGIELEMLMQGDYHAIMKIFIRGNRFYVLMAQKINKTEKISANDGFFKSFKLEEYAEIEPTTYQPNDADFKVSLFDNVKVTKDTVGYESSRLKQSTNYFSVNPTSGGLYHINRGELQEYVQIKDLKEFYDEHIELYKEWNDSIISQREVNIDGKQGKVFALENKYSKMVELHQMWIDNDQLYVMTGYLSEEERKNSLSDLIFDSFKNDSSKNPQFDRFSSKSDLLLRDLQSTDSLQFKRALGSFEYYKFEPTDLPKLYQSLKETYQDTLYANAIKEIIISVFPTTHDAKTIENLKSLYTTTFKDDQEIKSAIISTIPNIDEENALDVYKQLLTESPPLSSENYYWEILSPFRDSIQFTVDNFKLLTSLMEYDLYRYSILNIATDLIKKHPDRKSLVLDEKDSLLKHAKKDLNLYLNTLNDSLADQYKYSGLMYAYLSFFNDTALNTVLSDEFTNKIIEVEESQWYVTHALTSRIRSQQLTDKSIVNRLLDSLNHRFDIMKAFHDIGKFEEVQDKYKEAEAFAELSIHSYLSEDDYEPESSLIMGEISKNNEIYYAYKVKYDEGEEALTSYIVTVGPIKDVSRMDELQLYEVHTDWEQLDIAKWESQAEKLIPANSTNED